MTYSDGPKARSAAFIEALKNMQMLEPLKEGEPCKICGRPLERLGRMDQEPFICCVPCEQTAQERDSDRDD